MGAEGIVRGDNFSNGFVNDAFFCTISETFGGVVNSGVVGTVAVDDTVAADEVGIIVQSGGGDETDGRGCTPGISLTVIELDKLLARTSPTQKNKVGS